MSVSQITLAPTVGVRFDTARSSDGVHSDGKSLATASWKTARFWSTALGDRPSCESWPLPEN